MRISERVDGLGGPNLSCLAWLARVGPVALRPLEEELVWVYFVAADPGYGDGCDRIKIGFSDRPLRHRLREVRREVAGMEIFLIGAVRTLRSDERALHDHFVADRIRADAEWFWWNEDIKRLAVVTGEEGRQVWLGARQDPALVHRRRAPKVVELL